MAGEKGQAVFKNSRLSLGAQGDRMMEPGVVPWMRPAWTPDTGGTILGTVMVWREWKAAVFQVTVPPW